MWKRFIWASIKHPIQAFPKWWKFLLFPKPSTTVIHLWGGKAWVEAETPKKMDILNLSYQCPFDWGIDPGTR